MQDDENYEADYADNESENERLHPVKRREDSKHAEISKRKFEMV